MLESKTKNVIKLCESALTLNNIQLDTLKTFTENKKIKSSWQLHTYIGSLTIHIKKKHNLVATVELNSNGIQIENQTETICLSSNRQLCSNNTSQCKESECIQMV